MTVRDGFEHGDAHDAYKERYPERCREFEPMLIADGTNLETLAVCPSLLCFRYTCGDFSWMGLRGMQTSQS